jgi:hypothetical protein
LKKLERSDSNRSTIEAEKAGTRRSFLKASAATAAVAAPALVMGSPSTILAAAPKKLTGFAATLIQEVMNDEAQHVPIIQNLLNDPDNPLPVPIRPAPNFNMKRLIQPNLQSFLETAAGFENTGSGLYGGALLNITQTQEYFPTAVGLCTVESRHASWLNSLLGQALVPDFVPVEEPIPQSTTLSRVAEFVTDPRSTFPSFRTDVVTDANNFAVLDFLLFLEYIESTFYRLNVPRFT